MPHSKRIAQQISSNLQTQGYDCTVDDSGVVLPAWEVRIEAQEGEERKAHDWVSISTNIFTIYRHLHGGFALELRAYPDNRSKLP